MQEVKFWYHYLLARMRGTGRTYNILPRPEAQMKSDIMVIIACLIAIAAMHMGQDTDADVREVYREAAQVIQIENQINRKEL